MNILLVESNSQQRLLVEKIMKVNAENVHASGNHQDALAHIKTTQIDLAIIDLDENPQESIALVRQIRAAEKKSGRKPYIIIGTEKGDTSNILEILEAGANEFIAKPYERAALEGKILLGSRIDYASDAIGVLTEEHQAILRMVKLLEYISGKVGKKDVPKKLLEWATSTSFMLDAKVHHAKEEHFMISFLEGALKEHSEQPDSTILSRSSLKTIEKEHVDLIEMQKEIQVNISRYSQGATGARAADLRDSIMNYVLLLKDHMIREERYLFPAARPLIDKDENIRLLREFQKVEIDVGVPKIDERLRIILAAEQLIDRKNAKGG
jgi:CheY-like chemotaxis protein